MRVISVFLLLALVTLAYSPAFPVVGSARDVVTDGEFAFIAHGTGGLEIQDITNPDSPFAVGSLVFTSYGAEAVAVEGKYAFVGLTGLSDPKGVFKFPFFRVVNFSHITVPTQVASLNLLKPVLGVAIRGPIVYLANSTSGLALVDVTDPTAPLLGATLATAGIAYDVVVDGEWAFVAEGTSGVQIFHVPSHVAGSLVGTYASGDTRGVAIDGDYLFVAIRDSLLEVVDVSNPASPVMVGSVTVGGFAYDVDVDGDLAYVATSNGFVHVVDVSDPTDPHHRGKFATAGSPAGIDARCLRGYVADGSAGLSVVPITKLTLPTLVGSAVTPDEALDVEVAGNYAFVATRTAGLTTWDITDPTNPTFAGTFVAPITSRGIAVAGNQAYLTDDFKGLSVYNVANPATPFFEGGVITTTFGVNHVALWGNHAFIATGNAFQVISILVPPSPLLVNSMTLTAPANGVYVREGLAYVANSIDGLTIVDVSNLPALTLVGTFATPGAAQRVEVDGRLAYVADLTGLSVVDISTPTLPTLKSTWTAPDAAFDVDVDGDLAFVAGGLAGLHVIDIKDPANPTLIGTYNTSGEAVGVAVRGEHAYVADRSGGLKVIRVRQSWFNPIAVGVSDPPRTSALVLYQNSPNPFNPSTSIRITLPADNMTAVVEIIDVRGRIVTTLTPPSRSAGDQVLEWDGRDHRGEAVASGVYFARLVTPTGVHTIKMHLIK